MLNTGQTIVPILVGIIQEATKENKYGYYWVSCLFLLNSIIGLVLTVILQVLDCKGENVLNKPKAAF